MIFRPFYCYDRGCAAYLFGCGTLGQCAVVDARVDDVNEYMAFAASQPMRITHVIDTHVHADHRSGARELAQRTDASYYLHESADAAHFSGSVCGTGLSGKPTSTIAFERRWNPMLSLDRDAFVAALADVPAKPAEMEQILAFNRGHADVKVHA